MKRLMNWLMLSCKKASELIEKKLHFRLTLKEKAQLKMHTGVCDACKSFAKDSERFEEAMQALLNKEPGPRDDTRLSEEAKARILNGLDHHEE